MLNFSSQPPLDATRYAMRLVRTPTKGKLQLIITCDEMLGCWTHWFSGRTTPCTGDGCEACEATSSARWHAYVSAHDFKTNEHLLFECTSAAAEAFAVYRAKHGTLRGCEFLAQRAAPRANARVCLRTKPADLTHVDLPQGANLRAALCHLWGVPMTETEIVHEDPRANSISHGGPGLPVDRGNGETQTVPIGTPIAPKAN